MAVLVPASTRFASSSPIVTAGGILLAVTALYFGRDLFIPFALAILLSFALTPVVNWLRRMSLPRLPAVLLTVAIAFIVIGGVAFVVGQQVVQLADNLPAYQQTITKKIRSLQASGPDGGLVEKITTTIQDIGSEISGKDDAGASRTTTTLGTASPSPDPVTVRLEPATPRPFEVIQRIVGPLIAPLATAGLVIIFVIFVLLEREDLRDRFIKLAGRGDLQKSTQAITDAASRVSRYLLMQLVVNLSYGVPIGIALYLIGIPNAVLWGLLAAVLRFIPYLGPFLASLFPLALAVAVDPGWTMLFSVVGLFVVAELISNNVVEPWLYGASTGLSSLAIIMSAIFWTMLWGPVGLFLATPLTVCLVVMGRYVPSLEFLGVLLGSDPVLAPEERFYQRLAAGNLEEATEIAETYVDEHSTHLFYDNVAIPALRLAENDRQRITSDANYRRLVADTAACVVREIEDHISEKADEGSSAADQRVLCLAGRTELDGAAAEMVAQALAERGIGARVLPPIAVSQGALGQLDLDGINIVCVSYLDPKPQVYARYICRRLRRRAPNIKLAICCWNLSPGDVQGEKQMGADAVFGSVEVCIEQMEAWLSRPSFLPEAPPAVPGTEQAQLKAVKQLAVSSSTNRQYDEVSARVAREFDVPIALVSFVEGADPSRAGVAGSSADHRVPDQLTHKDSLEAHVCLANEVLVSEDVQKDPRFADDSIVLEKGIRFYAGAPLRTSAGIVVGSLGIVDTKPRQFAAEDRIRLQATADELMTQIEGGQSPADNQEVLQ